jgi:hypothetical protein
MNLIVVVSPIIIALLLVYFYKDKNDITCNKNNNNSKNTLSKISNIDNTDNKKENNMENSENNTENKKEMNQNGCNNNINSRINKAFNQYSKEIDKYKLGSKSYEYDIIPNEQPLRGLKADYEQNYPSTLKKSNKMFVDPDLTIKYTDLLNTTNNSLKSYYDNYL